MWDIHRQHFLPSGPGGRIEGILDPRTRVEGEVSQRNLPLPSAVVSRRGHHEPVAACADFLIRVLESVG